MLHVRDRDMCFQDVHLLRAKKKEGRFDVLVARSHPPPFAPPSRRWRSDGATNMSPLRGLGVFVKCAGPILGSVPIIIGYLLLFLLCTAQRLTGRKVA